MVYLFLQDGLNNLVDEIKNSHIQLDYKGSYIDAVMYTLLYANRYYVEKVSCGTKAKASTIQKPMYKAKFGLLFR